MNIKTVALTESGAEFGALSVPLSREVIESARNSGDGKVTVGFRPEATDLVSPSEGGLPIVVDLVEDLGSDANVYGHAAMDAGGAGGGTARPRSMPKWQTATSSRRPTSASVHPPAARSLSSRLSKGAPSWSRPFQF